MAAVLDAAVVRHARQQPDRRRRAGALRRADASARRRKDARSRCASSLPGAFRSRWSAAVVCYILGMLIWVLPYAG